MGDGRGWGQGAGNERRVACGQGIEDPCPRYLVHVMRGNGHKENRGTERLRPPLRVKASHQLNPGDPGLKVALEPWSPWIPAAPAASCCSDLGRGWPPTCPGGPPTPSRQQRLGGAEGTPSCSQRGVLGPEGQSTPVCPQGWVSPAKWGHGLGAPPSGGAWLWAPAEGARAAGGARAAFLQKSGRTGLWGAPWGRGVHRGWQLAKGAPGQVQLWGQQSQWAAAFSLTADHLRPPAPSALLPFPPGRGSWPHPIQGELQGLLSPLQGPAHHSLPRLSPWCRWSGRGVRAGRGLQTRPPPGGQGLGSSSDCSLAALLELAGASGGSGHWAPWGQVPTAWAEGPGPSPWSLFPDKRPALVSLKRPLEGGASSLGPWGPGRDPPGRSPQ